MSEHVLSVTHNKEVNLATGNVQSNVFVKVYQSMFNSGLVARIGPQNFTALMALAIHMDENGECFPTQERLAELIGVHKNTVNKYINSLLAIEFDGQPLVTREKVNKGMGMIQSRYKIHPISQVAIFDGKVKEVSHKSSDTDNHKFDDTEITNVSDPLITTNCAVTRNNLTITNKQDKDIAEDSKPLNSSSAIKLFQAVYRDTYNVNYVVANYGRDGKLLKDKVLTPYPDLAREIIETAVREYASRWKNNRYPRPSISMFSWVTNQVVEVLEENKQIEEIAAMSDEIEKQAEQEMLDKLNKLG